MPNPIIPLPQFPAVAQLPGVPQLVRASSALNTVTLAIGAVQSFLGPAAGSLPTWGLFDSAGNLVLQPDNILGFENQNPWRISDFPLQDGEFASYNKVKLPYTASLKITKGGTIQDRKNLLDKLQSIAGDTKVYSILSPEKSYPSVNIENYRIRRMGKDGAYYFADLEIFFRNIQSTPSQYSSTTANTANAVNPVALPTTNLGTQLPGLVGGVPSAIQQVVTVRILPN